jgi:hypothetical protein
MSKQKEKNKVVNEIIDYYNEWLKKSNMTEEDLLKYRTVTHFAVEKDIIEDTGQAMVFMRYNNGIGFEFIGCPFISESVETNDSFLYDAVLVVAHITGKLDKANRDNPIGGSYCNDYFGVRLRKFIRKEGII